nr:T9SS sorting signal type C domain-containing protein [Flavobacterium sp.]
AGTYNDRFMLRYTNGALATEDFQNSNSVVVASGKENVKVRSYASDISAIAVYDVLGREIFSKDQINNTEFSIPGLLANQQTLVVKIKLSNGQTVIRKTIY